MRPEKRAEMAALADRFADNRAFYEDLVDWNVDEDARSMLDYLVSTGAIVAQAPECVYRNYYHLVLQHGGRPRRAPLELPDWVDPMELRNCYQNAFDMAMEWPELTYVEGFALGSFMPVMHAWLEHDDGTIIDPTWSQPELQQHAESAVYLGVRFERSLLFSLTHEYRIYGIYTGDSETNCPILRYGLEFENDTAIKRKEVVA